MGIVLQVLYLFVGMALGRNASFSLFATSGLPWFMFAMAAWKSLCWILSGRSAVAVFAIAVSLGLAIRYDTINFDLFEIGRIVIFFPFYWAGFSLTPEKVLRVLRRRACVVVSACSVLAFLLACFVFTDSVYAYRTVFTAHSAYASVPIKNCGWPHQLLAYGVAAMLCASFISIFSMLRLKVLARWGQRTPCRVQLALPGGVRFAGSRHTSQLAERRRVGEEGTSGFLSRSLPRLFCRSRCFRNRSTPCVLC